MARGDSTLTRSQLAVYEELKYYTPEAPITAYEIGRKTLGWNGTREAVRRRVRRFMHNLRELVPNYVGTCADGYFKIRTAEDRQASRDFIRNHALREMHTARKRIHNPNQEAAL